jgi:mannose-1-phosphate guanylyltransferase
MKAMVLTAGAGTRLGSLTARVPKPMVPVAGRPILDYTIGHLVRHGVQDLVINLHFHADMIRTYCGDGSRWGARIRYSPEAELLGTAGALAPWRAFFDRTFMVVYGDNLTTCDLTRLRAFHGERRADATLALYWRDQPGAGGIAEVDADGRILRFLEKPSPEQIFSRWVNAGLLVLEPGLLDFVPDGRAADFGRDVLPACVAAGRRVFGYRMPAGERLWWIDTPEDLDRVQAELAGGGPP